VALRILRMSIPLYQILFFVIEIQVLKEIVF
jgi:hypothetical protein